jgi:hypothetical protein
MEVLISIAGIAFFISASACLVLSGMSLDKKTIGGYSQVLTPLLAGLSGVAAGISVFVLRSASDRELLAGFQHPFFYVCVPIGIGWLIWANVLRNRRLTRCPDCMGYVSRLAATCPRCGRPLVSVADNEKDAEATAPPRSPN